MAPPKLLSADELAERWQVSRAHVYRLTRNAKVPAIRIGRIYRYRLDLIEDWEKQQAAESVDDPHHVDP